MQNAEISIRQLNPDADLAQVGRIWQEIAWVDDEDQAKHLQYFLRNACGYVAVIHGEVEACVTAHAGTTMYEGSELPMWAVTSVTVSRVARRLGLAGALTSRLLAEGARRGFVIAMLGMFEQGFYDRLGFGTGSCERFLRFDPLSLITGPPTQRPTHRPTHRPPQRISAADYLAVHRGRLASRRSHGFTYLDDPEMLRAEMELTKGGFGLGYFNEDRSMVTHHLWCKPEGEHGPYEIWWYSYRDDRDFMELLQLVKGLGDQVHVVEMKEPPGLSLQDFITKPFKQRRITNKGPFESKHSSAAYWQLRILDMPRAFAAGPASAAEALSIVFNVQDPVSRRLAEPGEAEEGSAAAWRGLSGRWLMQTGAEPGLRRLDGEHAYQIDHEIEIQIGALSRLWFGSASARSLALQGTLSAAPEAVEALDRVFSVPEPHPWWDF